MVAIVGRTGLAEDPGLAEAVAAFAEGFPGAKVLPVARRSNLYGALDMGVAPDLLPGRVPLADPAAWEALEVRWDGLPGGEGDDAAGIIAGLEEGRIRALVLLGSDPAADFPDPARARAALQRRRPGRGPRPVPHRVVAPGSRGAPRPRLCRGGGHGHQPGRPGAEGEPPRPRPRAGASGQRDPRGSRRPPGPLHRGGVGRGPGRGDLRERPGLRRGVLGSARPGPRPGGPAAAHSRSLRAAPGGPVRKRRATSCCTWPGSSTTGAPWCSKGRRWPASPRRRAAPAPLRRRPHRGGGGRTGAPDRERGHPPTCRWPSTPPSPRARCTCRPAWGHPWAAACGSAWRPCRERAREPLRQHLVHRRGQGGGCLRAADGRGDPAGVDRAQGRRRHAEPHRPQPRRPLGHPADGGRRPQAAVQGVGRPAQGSVGDLPGRPHRRHGPRLLDLPGDPHRAAFQHWGHSRSPCR